MTEPAGETGDYLMMQAAHWCMRLREADCSLEERRAFEDWLQGDPSHAFEYARMLEVWDLAGQLSPSVLAP
ncbi:DUF4880 domain-containing protein [Pseudomonas sp. Fl5BN2]|uniref:FecR/PupR family sigma factor regulator n=1 Tax=unclassified Pseudomonas TaxID=196821 RepID=UPI0013781275|nr:MULTISPECIES: DUF4880 domain-containing protein [unclassified Pseudomonas]NBF01966.1 DUF4880 domain-containing protein [Pseudomonas sp. Fl5BN2]NBF08095.1 DUF4880 domain-containing protein [Pseudomonas sp. Fl4BN1]